MSINSKMEIISISEPINTTRCKLNVIIDNIQNTSFVNKIAKPYFPKLSQANRF